AMNVKLSKDLKLGDNGSVVIGGTTVNNEGLKITGGPSITTGGIDAGNKVIRNVADGTEEGDAVNFKQLTEVKDAAKASTDDLEEQLNTLADTGLGFTADHGEAFTRKLDEAVNVTGGAALEDLTDDNIGVVSEPHTGSLGIKLSKNLNLGNDGSVVIGGTTVNNEGLKITGGPSITTGGIDAGNKVITNVA
nr:hypothetical protein [Neisseria sp. 51.81]